VGLGSFEQFRFVRLLSAPAVADVPDQDRRFLPALVSAHARAQPIVLGWLNGVQISPDDAAPENGFVVVAGAPDAPRAFPFLDAAGEQSRPGCLFPPGGRAAPLDGPATVAALTSLPAWTLLAAEPALPDPHQATVTATQWPGRRNPPEAADAPEPELRGGYEDVALHLSSVPFAWLLVAEPVASGEAQDEFRATQSAARSLTNTAQLPGEQALELSLATARLEHLHLGRSVGLWRVRWLVGSTSKDRVQEVAELLVATSALHRHPLRMVTTPHADGLCEMLAAASVAGAWNEPLAPFLTTSDHLAALGRTPGREIPGFRLTLQQTFDTNVEKLPPTEPAVGQPALTLGVMLDPWGRATGDFGISSDALNRHMFVCGATGSGKSQTVRQLLEELSAQAVPWLVIEPVKAEYRCMADRLGEAGIPVHVIRLGATDHPPCTLNPLEPERGFNLQTHVDMVTSLFLAAFEAEEPFPQVLTESLRRCYENLGWDLATGRYKAAHPGPADDRDGRAAFPTYPTLTELQAVADQVVTGIGYGPEVQANVRGFMKVRLGSLRLGTPGRFFESGHPLSVALLLQRNVVVELEDVGNDQDKAFVIGAVLLRLVENLRVNRPRSDVLRHVTVIEEAHRLLRRPERSGPASHAIETFAGLLAEVRAYGEGLVVAEQIPTKIVPDVVKNTAIQVMHRLPASDDRELVGGAMNMTSEQMDYVVGVGRGQAAVFSEGMDRPVLVAMRLGKDREADALGARTAVELLAGRRSPSCPSSCQNAPCTVTEMQAAASWAARLRGLDLYVELLAVGLLRPGGPAVLPVDPLLTAVRDALERHRDCGLGQLAQATVQRRRAVLAEYIDPGEVLAALVAFLHDATAGPDVNLDPVRWSELAEPCRLPDTLDGARRIEAFVGDDVASLGSPLVETVHSPLLDLARVCQAEDPAAPGRPLGRRIAQVVGDLDVGEDLTSLLKWCFNWVE
jgi:hypothetical protein